MLILMVVIALAAPTPPAAHTAAVRASSLPSSWILLFGGTGSSPLNDTWSYVPAPTNTWTDLAPPSAPSPRGHPVLASDSRTGQVILFGGWGGPYNSAPLNDTWSYDPSTNRWTNQSPSSHPEFGYQVYADSAAMVYNSQANRMILFGAVGSTYGSPDQTWAYDPDANAWTQMHPASSPYGSHDFGLVYDSAADRVLYFSGGSPAPHYYDIGGNATWAYDFRNDTWTSLAPTLSPPIRYGSAMAYDSKVDRTLLFGGCTNGLQLWPSCALANDTWSYEFGANAWTNRSPVSSPPAGRNHPMTYDSAADRVILFGTGYGAGNDTWSYDYAANAWTAMTPSQSPPTRTEAGMVYVSFEPSSVPGGGSGNTTALPMEWIGVGALVLAAAAVVVFAALSRRRRQPGPPT